MSGFSGGAGGATVNGQTGAVVSYFAPQHRVTLTAATPVLTSTVSAAATVYVSPYVGNLMPIYDGTNIVPTAWAETSQATTDATKSPAACTTNSNYDIFCWNDAGTLRSTRGPAWTSSTARGTGAGTTELVRVNGLWLNANAITNGPAAQRGTYVGTVRTNGSSTVDYTFGSLAAGGGAASFGLWNAYNRRYVLGNVADSNTAWTYTSGTIRAADNSSTFRTSFVMGLAEDAITATYQTGASTAAASGALGYIGIALDATNAQDVRHRLVAVGTSSNEAPMAVKSDYAPQLGFHFIQATERGDNTTATTFAPIGDASLQVGVFN